MQQVGISILAEFNHIEQYYSGYWFSVLESDVTEWSHATLFSVSVIHLLR